MSTVRGDIKYFIGGSGIIILTLVGVMFFSPLASRFSDEAARSGYSWVDMEIAELVEAGRAVQALELVDSVIAVKGKDLPRFAYFDRFLSKDEWYDAVNARADIYELQWSRIDILQILKRTDDLRKALEGYSRVEGYNQAAAKLMLEQLNSR
jgi:hypothetical protein